MPSLVLNALYPHSVEKVWSALIDPQALARWLLPTEGFAPVKGTKFLFRGKPAMGWKGIFYCEILEATPLKTLSWSQRDQEYLSEGSTVSLTLSVEDSGTRLTVHHSGLSGVKGRIMNPVLRQGWRVILDRLGTLLLEVPS